jgi:hypothetical protein
MKHHRAEAALNEALDRLRDRLGDPAVGEPLISLGEALNAMYELEEYHAARGASWYDVLQTPGRVAGRPDNRRTDVFAVSSPTFRPKWRAWSQRSFGSRKPRAEEVVADEAVAEWSITEAQSLRRNTGGRCSLSCRRRPNERRMSRRRLSGERRRSARVTSRRERAASMATLS